MTTNTQINEIRILANIRKLVMNPVRGRGRDADNGTEHKVEHMYKP